MNIKIEVLGESQGNIPYIEAQIDEMDTEVTICAYEDAEWMPIEWTSPEGKRQKLPPGRITIMVKSDAFAAWARGCAAALSHKQEGS